MHFVCDADNEYWLHLASIRASYLSYSEAQAASIPEAVFTLVYMLFIIGLNAFIIGTLTLVVMKNDERTGQYRQRASNLKQNSSVNGIRPVSLSVRLALCSSISALNEFNLIHKQCICTSNVGFALLKRGCSYCIYTLVEIKKRVASAILEVIREYIMDLSEREETMGFGHAETKGRNARAP